MVNMLVTSRHSVLGHILTTTHQTKSMQLLVTVVLQLLRLHHENRGG